MRRMIGPVLFGVIGAAILIGLGVWQIARLGQKEAMLAEINAMIVAAPVELPAQPDVAVDRYRPVTATGRFTGEFVEVLSGVKDEGPGALVIAVFETAGRRVLVDRGFRFEAARGQALTATDAVIVGNLQWPRETDSFTPPPDAKTGLWFARDVGAMAAALHTEPTLIVAREPTGDAIAPVPVDTSSIPNDHWQYALTWFSLAAVWLGMTAGWLWRITRAGPKG